MMDNLELISVSSVLRWLIHSSLLLTFKFNYRAASTPSVRRLAGARKGRVYPRHPVSH
jgi:hypothetical protein